MKRVIGTASMGLRAPIIKKGDDVGKAVIGTIKVAIDNGEITPRDRDIVGVTETIDVVLQHLDAAYQLGFSDSFAQVKAMIDAKVPGEAEPRPQIVMLTPVEMRISGQEILVSV